MLVSEAHPEIVPGVGIGPWLVRERHDRGSFGLILQVARADHPETGPFALKIALHADDARFPREVWALHHFHHSSIPRFEDRGWWKNAEGDNFPYLVMEWVKGLPLYEWARQQKPTSAQVLQVLAQLAGALAVAHAAGAVHRDVKGDNILVTAEGRAVLLDWGCGIHEGAKDVTDTVLPPGTSSYRAPEAVRWAWAHRKDTLQYEACPADDVYALGATAYRLCTGTYPPAPVEGSLPQRRLLPPRELATVSAGLDQLLLACLSQDRPARPATAALAIALSVAVGERDVTKPILPTPAAKDTEEASSPGRRPRWTWPGWASTAVAAIGGGLTAGVMVLLAVHGGSDRSPPAPLPAWDPPVALEHPAPEMPDGGVGEQVLADIEAAPKVVLPAMLAVGRPMPSKPYPGQKKPPCDPEAQRVINGFCWVGPLGKKKPPCGPEYFDYEDGCYLPLVAEPRAPTSEDPR